MPITNEIDASGNLTTITGIGEVTFGEVTDAMRTFYENPTPNVLLIWSEANLRSLPYPAVEKAAVFLTQLRKNALKGRTAIVSSDVLNYGVAREFEILLNLDEENLARETMVFQTVEEALAWLSEPASEY